MRSSSGPEALADIKGHWWGPSRLQDLVCDMATGREINASGNGKVAVAVATAMSEAKTREKNVEFVSSLR
jgi:hypothetical protein